jgi:hypothetical protein
MAQGIGPAIFGPAVNAIDAIDYTNASILVWVIASDEDAAREIVEQGTTFHGLLWVDLYGQHADGKSLYLFTFEGAENA